MNLIEHYIIKVYDINNKTTQNGLELVVVWLKTDCCGCIETKEYVFIKDEWDTVYKNGYFMN